MEKFKFLDDVAIADVCFEAYGGDLNELFENSALALFEVMVDTEEMQNAKCKMQNLNSKLKIKANSLENLLFDFLSELVFLKDKDALLFNRFKVNVVGDDGWELNAECFGEKIDPGKQHLRVDVKAVTWHMFKIEKIEEGYKARVVVDI